MKYSKLTKKQTEKLHKAIDKEFKAAMKHFKNDGWALDFSFIVDCAIYEFLGGHVSDELWMKFTSKKLKFKFKKYGLAVHDPTYEPVYYNERSGKIVLPGPEYNVMDYLTGDGFISLGRL